jgi:hypothetical protein
MATKKPGITEIKIRMPTLIKKSLDDLAKREGNTTPSVIRRFISDSLDEKRFIKPEKPEK